ncbi:hypothetical protein N2152v2_009168 [Parachlorella kessleri]
MAYSLAQQLKDCRDVHKCVSFLRSLEGRVATSAFNAALKHLPPGAALEVWQQMQQQGVEPDTYTANSIAEMYAALGMHDLLDVLMADLLVRHKQLAHWAVFMTWADVHALAGNPTGVRHVMKALEGCGLELTSHYWTLLMKANSRASLRGPAIEGVLEEMAERGIAPTEEVYRNAIHCYGILGRADRAALVFQRMLAAGIQPGVATYSSMINAYADSCMPEQALQTMRAMHRAGVGPSLMAYTALMKAFKRIGDVDRAKAVLTTMKWEGIKPNNYSYTELVNTCVVAKKPVAARRAVDEMRAAGLGPDVIVLTSLMACYAAVGDVARTRGVLEEMRGAGVKPNAKSYTVLLQLMGNQGHPAEAQAVFDEMVGQGLQPDLAACCLLVDAWLDSWSRGRDGRSEMLLKAQEFFHGMGRQHLRPRLISRPGTALLDLHAHSPWTAQLAVLDVLQRLLRGYRVDKGASVPQLEVVTGRGNRSLVRNKSPLRDCTLALLQQLVTVRVARNNDGLLVVESKHMERLLRHMARKGRSFSLQDMKEHLVAPSM